MTTYGTIIALTTQVIGEKVSIEKYLVLHCNVATQLA